MADEEKDERFEQAEGVIAAIRATGFESEWLEILGEGLPLLKAGMSLRDMHLQRKMRRLLQGVAKADPDTKQAAMLKLYADEGFRQQFGAHLFHAVDSFDRVEKVDMLVNAFLGLAANDMTTNAYQRMARAIRHLLVPDLVGFIRKGDHVMNWNPMVAEDLCAVGLLQRDTRVPAQPQASAGGIYKQDFEVSPLGEMFLRCQRDGLAGTHLGELVDGGT